MAKIHPSYIHLPSLTLGDAGADPAEVGQIFRNGNSVKIFTGLGVRNMTFAPVLVEKTADETVSNSTTLQNDDALILPLLASERWFISLLLRFNSSAVADIKFGWSVPSGASMLWMRSNTSGAAENTASDTETVGGTGGNALSYVVGVVTVGTTAGNLTLRWAQDVAEVSDTKVLARSALVGLKLA